MNQAYRDNALSEFEHRGRWQHRPQEVREMRGLMRIQNRLNRIEAWADWQRLAATAPEIARRFTPPETAGARTIDKRIAALRAALAEAKEATPPAA